jgi:hypothetical protein
MSTTAVSQLEGRRETLVGQIAEIDSQLERLRATTFPEPTPFAEQAVPEGWTRAQCELCGTPTVLSLDSLRNPETRGIQGIHGGRPAVPCGGCWARRELAFMRNNGHIRGNGAYSFDLANFKDAKFDPGEIYATFDFAQLTQGWRPEVEDYFAKHLAKEPPGAGRIIFTVCGPVERVHRSTKKEFRRTALGNGVFKEEFVDVEQVDKTPWQQRYFRIATVLRNPESTRAENIPAVTLFSTGDTGYCVKPPGF